MLLAFREEEDVIELGVISKDFPRVWEVGLEEWIEFEKIEMKGESIFRGKAWRSTWFVQGQHYQVPLGSHRPFWKMLHSAGFYSEISWGDWRPEHLLHVFFTSHLVSSLVWRLQSNSLSTLHSSGFAFMSCPVIVFCFLVKPLSAWKVWAQWFYSVSLFCPTH